MAYADLRVIVDGALDSEETFHDYLLMNARLEQIKADAESDGQPTEVFILYHEHEDNGEECMCIQYETDHKPYASYNIPD